MKISEIVRLDEMAPLLDKLSKYGSAHYGIKDEKEGLLLLLARSMVHSREDDEYLKEQVATLIQKVSDLEKKIKNIQAQDDRHDVQ